MRHKKHLDFELNLIPCIDLLSVCICFLLLTAVWLQVGSINVKQGIGGQAKADTAKKPQLWVMLGAKGDLRFDLRDSKRGGSLNIKGVDGRSNYEEVTKAIARFKAAEPELKTVLIQPRLQSEYEEIIDLMDEFKKGGLSDLGVVPL
jgi:biopolymer transport protein TolR